MMRRVGSYVEEYGGQASLLVAAGSRAVVDVAYQKDKALAMWVPSRMTERYSVGPKVNATTVATYSDFKRFQTSVKIR